MAAAELPVFPFAGDGVAVVHRHRALGQGGQQRIQLRARIAEFFAADLVLGALRELQIERAFQIFCMILAEHAFQRCDAVDGDGARVLRIALAVKLGHARAVGNADQVDLFGAQGFSGGIQIADGV